MIFMSLLLKMKCLRPEAANEDCYIIHVHWKFQIVCLRCSLFFFFARKAFSLWLRREGGKYIFSALFWIFFVSFLLRQSPNYSLYMCVSSSPPPSLCCILSGFPFPIVFCFSPTSGPTDPYVLVLISFPDWTHFLSWPCFSWPSPSFLYTCPEWFSCQTQNMVWKSLNKAKQWKMQKIVVLYAVLLFPYTARGDSSMHASEDWIRYRVASIPKIFLSIKGQMQTLSKFVQLSCDNKMIFYTRCGFDPWRRKIPEIMK